MANTVLGWEATERQHATLNGESPLKGYIGITDRKYAAQSNPVLGGRSVTPRCAGDKLAFFQSGERTSSKSSKGRAPPRANLPCPPNSPSNQPPAGLSSPVPRKSADEEPERVSQGDQQAKRKVPQSSTTIRESAMPLGA